MPTLQSLVELFDYLRDEHVHVLDQRASSPIDDLIAQYGHYLTQDRGLAPLTIVRYQRMAKRFLVRRASGNGGVTGAKGLNAAEVHDYLLECCSRLVIESAKREAADLRSLLRFLYLQDSTATDLGSALPPVAGWRDTRLPKTMSATQVTAILDSCDRSRPAGLRDFAILTLLARLGLRSGEVAALRLTDIDWRAGEIWVRGKARRETRMPLTVDVGEAIVDYLRHGRPPTPCPRVILTSYAPLRGIHPSSITRVVYRACQRAGLPLVGGHRLRHALATEMLRQGGNLLEISQVLRHRDLATSSVYAKLDLTVLRTVARPRTAGSGRRPASSCAGGPAMTSFATTLQLFFTERLARQRQASPCTVTAYRNTFRLLLRFLQDRHGKAPSDLDWEDLNTQAVAAFLDYLETDRGNSARSRNARLAAIRSLFRYAALRHPEHAQLIAQVLAIPQKRFDRTPVSFLQPAEVDALLAAPDSSRWEGRRDRALLILAAPRPLRTDR